MSDEKKGDITTGKTDKNVAQAQAVSELKLASVTGAEAGAIVQGRSKANRGFIGRILKPIWPSVVSRHVFDLRDHLDNDNSTTWANAQSVLPDDQWTHFAGRDFTSRLQQALFCTRQELDDLLDGGISVMTIYFNLKKHSKEEKAASWYKVHSKDKQVKLETQIFKKEPFKILFDRITIHDGRPLDVPFQLYNEGQGTQAKYFRIAWEECPDEDKKNGITFDHVKRAIEQRENPMAVPTYFLNPHNLYVQAAESSANPHDSSPAGLASHAKRKRLEEDRQDKELCKGEKPRVLFYLICREQDARVKPRVEWITDPVKIKQMLDDKEANKANAELRYTAFINIDGIKMCLASDAKPWLIKYDRMAANRENIIENEFEKAGASGVDTNIKSDIKTNAQDAPKLLQSFQEHASKDVQVNEDDSDDDADERAEQASAGNRDGQRWKSRNETYKGSTFLVSLPQKSVRQCNSEAAVLAIYKLMNTSAEYSPRDFEYRDGWQKAILRLPIINIEDGILHPDSGVIGWMNIAACKRPYSWRPSTKLIHFTLSYTADLARIPIRETLPDAAKGQPLKYTDPVSWSSLFGQALKNKPQEVALLATLIARSDARGMKGDKLMCARFARLWYKRFVDKSPDGNMPCNSRQGLVKLWQRYNVSTAGHTLLETISDDWLKSDVLWYISAIDIHNEICMADDVLIELPTVREQIIDAYEKRSRAEIDAKAKRKAESKHSDAQSKQSDKRPKKPKAKPEKRPSEKPKSTSKTKTSKKSTPSAFKTYISKNKLEQQEQRKLEKEAKQAQKAEIKNQKNDSVLAKTRKNVGPKTAETICEYIWEYRSRWNRKKCMAFWPESSVQQSESKNNNHLFDRICGPVDEKLNSIALNIIHAQSMIQCIREHSERSACSFTSECTGKMVDRALVWTRQVIDKHLSDVIVKPADTSVDAIASTATSAALAPIQMTLSQSLAMPLSTMTSTHSAHQQYSYTWNPPKINPKRHIRNICYMARAEPFEAEITRSELVKDTSLTVQHKYTLYRNRDNMICIVCTSMDTRPNGSISFDDVCMVHASLYLDQKRETESKSQGHVAVVAVTAKKLKKPKSGSKKRKNEDESLDFNSDAGSSNESDAQDSENDNDDDDDGGVVSRMKKRRKESKKKANESKNKNSKHDLDNDDVDNDGDDKKRRGRGTKRKAETQPSSKRGKKKRIIAELDTETREQDIWDKYRKHYKTALCSSPFKVAEKWCPAQDTNKNGLANGQNDDDDDDNDKTRKQDKVANNSTAAGVKPSRRTKTVTVDDLQKITMPSDIGLSKDLFGLDNVNWKEDLIRLVRDFFIVQHPKIFNSEPIKYQCAWYPEGGYTLGQGKGQILEIKAAYTTRRHEWTLTRGEDEIKFKLVNDKFAKNEEFTKKSMKRFLGIENPRMVDTPATGGVIGASDLSDMTIDSVTDHRLYDLLSQLQKQSKQFQPMHTNVMQFSKRPLLDSAVATTTKKSKTTTSSSSKGKPETKANSDADSDNEDDGDDQENDSNDDDDDDEDIDTKLNGKVVKQSKPKPKAKVYELAPMPMEVTNKDDDDDQEGKEQQLNVEAVLTQPKAKEPNIGEIAYVKQQSTYSRRYLGHLADQMVAVTTENPKQDCDYLLRWVFLLMRLAYHDMIMPSRGKLGYSKVIAAAINPLSAINIITPTSLEMTMTRHRLCPLALLVSTGILQCRRVDASERKHAGETSNGGKKYHIVSGSHVLTSQLVQLCSFIMERIKDQVAPAKAKKSKIADESKKNGKKKHGQRASKIENQDEYKIVCPEVYADLALDALLAQRKYKDTLETSCQIVYEKLRSVLSGSEKSVKFNRRRRGEKRPDKMPGPFDHDARLICMALFLPCGIFVPDTTDLLYEWKPLPRLSQQCIESLMDMVRNFEFRCRRSATLGGPITLATLDKPLPPLLTIGQRIAIRCTAIVDETIVSELERQSLNEIHERLRKIYRSGHVENMNEYIGLLYCRVLKRLGGDQQDGQSAKGNMETSQGKIKNVHADSDDSEDDDDDSVEKKKKKQGKRDQTSRVEPRTLHTWQKQGLWWLLCCSLSNKAGGILGDDMGLGKTLQALCLVVAFQPLPFVRLNKRRGSVIVPGMDESSSGDEHQEDGTGSNSDSNASGSEQDNDGDNDNDSDNDVDVDIGKTLKRSLGGSREKKQPLVDVTLFEHKWRPILVVCPAINLLSPWLSEIVNPAIFGHLLACYIHHNDSCHIYLPQDGAPKKRKEKLITEPEDLERFDIIVTSYNTLAAEFKRGKSVLHAIDWHIVILDECTYIKNDATDMFKAVSHLNAAIRIAMSGTPSHGKPKDIHTLVKFLRIMPYSSSEWLKEYPKRYMEIHEIMLRRHKLAVIEARKRIIEPFVAMEPFEALVYRYSDLVRQQHLRDRHVPEHYIVHPREEEETKAKAKTKAKGETKQIVSSSFASSQHSLPRIKQYDRHYVEQWQMRMINSCTSLLSWWRKPANSKDKNQPANILASWFKRDKKTLKRLGKSGSKLAKNEAEDGIETKDMDETGTKESTNLEQTISKNTNETARLAILSELLAKFRGPTKIFFGKVASGLSLCGDTKMRQKCVTKLKLAPQLRNTGKLKYLEYVLDNLMQPSDVTEHTSIIYSSMSDKKIKAFFKQHRIISSDSAMDLLKSLLYAMFTSGENGNGVKKWFKRLQVSSTYGTHKLGNEEWTCIGQLIQCRIIDIKPVSITNCIQGITGAVSQERMVATLGTVRPNWNQPGVMAQFLYDLRSEAYKTMQLLNPGKQHNSNIMEDDDDEDAKNVDDDDDNDDEGSDFRRRRNSLSSGAGSSSGLSLDIERFHNGGGGMGNGLMQRSKYSASRKTSTSKQKQDAAAKTKAKKNQFKLIGKRPGKQTVEMKRLDEIKKLVMPYNFEWETTHIAAELLRSIVNMPLLYPPHLQGEQEGVAITSTESRLVTSREKLVIFCSNQYTVALTELIVQERMSKLGYGYVVVNSQGAHGEVDQCTLAKDLLNRNTMWKRNLHRVFVKGFAYASKDVSNTIGHCAECLFKWQVAGQVGKAMAEEEFQSQERCRVFITTFGVAGHGITLTAGCNVLMMDRSWNPADYSQAEDRVFRIGQTRNTVWIMRPEMRLCGKGVPPLQTLLMDETKDEKKQDESNKTDGAADTLCDVACTLVPSAERHMVEIVKNRQRVQKNMVESGTKSVQVTTKDVQTLKQAAAEETLELKNAKNVNKAKKEKEKQKEKQKKKPKTSSKKTSDDMDTEDESD